MKELTKVAIRMFALTILVKFIIQLPTLLYMFDDTGEAIRLVELIYYSAILIVQIALATYFWIYNDFVATLMVGKIVQEEIKVNLSYSELLSIALKFFGLVMIVSAINPAIRTIQTIYLMSTYTNDLKIDATIVIRLVESIIKIGMGLFILLMKPKDVKTVTETED